MTNLLLSNCCIYESMRILRQTKCCVCGGGGGGGGGDFNILAGLYYNLNRYLQMLLLLME